MEKRVSYYVSRKSFLVWLSALVMTASAALRIAYSCGKGADASTVWFQIVLPVAACLIFVLMILLGGEERFYRTAIPAFMLAIYYSVRVSAVLPSLSLRFVFWVAYLAMAGLYAADGLRSPAQQLGAGSAAGRRDRRSCLHAPHSLYQRQLVGPRGISARTSVFDGRLFFRSCHAAARRRKVPPHLGRPCRRPQAADAGPRAGRRKLHHADARWVFQLRAGLCGDHRHGALHPRKAPRGAYKLRHYACVLSSLRAHRG